MYKNLEAHNKRKHKGEKLKCRSTHSRHLSSLISKKGDGCGDTSSISEVKMEEKRLLSPCCQTSKVVEPPIKVTCLEYHFKNSQFHYKSSNLLVFCDL